MDNDDNPTSSNQDIAMEIEVSSIREAAMSSQTCREVFQTVLQNPVYTGDYRGLSGQTSVLHAIEETDMLIHRLLEHKRSLRSFRNSLQPICRLPWEIIVQIFSNCPLSFYGVNRKTTLAFSQISQGLRRVALGTPTLWTSIPATHPLLAQELLSRSGGLPLDVSMCINSRISTTSEDLARGLVATYFSNFKRFHLNAAPDVVEEFASTFQNSSPILKELALSADYSCTVLPYNGSWNMAPSSTLDLHGCLFPFDSSAYQNLQCLKVSTIESVDDVLVDLSEVLAMLRRNPELEELELSYVMGLVTSSAAASASEVVLSPVLRSITLQGGEPHIWLLFLAKVVAPKLDYIHLTHIAIDPISDAEVMRLADRLFTQFSAGEDLILSTLQCKEDSAGENSMSFGLRQRGHKALTYAKLEVEFWEPTDANSMFPFVSHILRPWPLQHLVDLVVNLPSDGVLNDALSFWQLLSPLPALRKIAINKSPPCLLAFLSVLQDSTTAFSALKTLVLIGITVKGMNPMGNDLQFLADILSYRETHGISIAYVKIDRCVFRSLPVDLSCFQSLSARVEVLRPRTKKRKSES